MTRNTAILIAWLISSGFVIEVISIFNDGFVWNDQTIEIQSTMENDSTPFAGDR